MELKSCLRRTQSLKSVASSRDTRPSWVDGERRGRNASVVQLVARYQNEVEDSANVKVTQATRSETKIIKVHQETKTKGTAAPAEVASQREGSAESQPKTAGERDWALASTKSRLSGSRSVGSLRNAPSSVRSLKDLYESKKGVGAALLDRPSRARSTDARPPEGRATAERKAAPLGDGNASDGARANDAKANNASLNSNKKEQELQVVEKQGGTNRERGTSNVGVDSEGMGASHQVDKQRSFEQTSVTQPISVKAISALYLSQTRVGRQRSNDKHLAKHPSESAKRPKPFKFQPSSQDMCSACLKPVYPMEKIMADNHIFHKSCFCCKHCKKTLSMQSYTPHLGSHYCIFHYQQLFKRRGNYDEGFGHAQHKSRWLPRAVVDESEA